MDNTSTMFDESKWLSFKKNLKKNVGDSAFNNWLKQQKKVFLKKSTYPESYPPYQNKFQKNNFFLIFFTFLLAKNT